MKQTVATTQHIRLNRKTLTMKPRTDYAEVIFIGDVHLGSPQFDEPRFVAMLDFCKKQNVYVFLMGDLLETATRHSVGAGVYEQDENADDQFDRMCNWLSPLAEKGLILGAHTGN